LRGLIYPEDGRYIAHALEIDLVAVGDTPRAALERLIEQLQFWAADAIEHDTVPQLMRPAPAPYWQAFARATMQGASVETAPTRSGLSRIFDRMQFVDLPDAPSAA
jgi:predicted RNase H-like HicB family nuclease